jgi:glutathione S-transferase
MSLTFYYSPQSSASPVHFVLEELGVPYEKVKIDLRAGDQKKPEFLKLNPNGCVPLLVHDGVPIFESAAIQLYLGEQFGVEKGLYPKPGVERGEVMKWVIWINATFGEAMSRFGRNMGPWAPEDERNAKAGTVAKSDVEKHLQTLEEALKGKQYLVGNKLTIADMHVGSWMDYVSMMKFDLKAYPNISAWVARVTERPTYKTGD